VKTAAIYARVSSERQKEERTIDSQVASLIEHAQKNGYIVPSEFTFKDEGYSGSILLRPGLERLRDLSSEGQIDTVLVYSPDRLSRKYAYQILLMEEFHRNGVEVIFINSPQGDSPEERLLLQLQGMIAEYERAQIAERSRRGKRYRAKCGSINVLSGAPYGYRYVKKTEDRSAYFEVIEREAEVVREVFRLYTEEFFSIGAMSRFLNSRNIPTRTGKGRWERSTIWGMLRNPAYKGRACYGKTEKAERQKITRPLRQKGGFSPRCSANRERPRDEWIEIAVPAIVNTEIFEQAQDLLERNKNFSARRTKKPTILQGLLVCSECGYSMYRTSTRTSKGKIYYYRCIGSDNYRHANGRVCSSRPLRQDYLDHLIWEQIIKLLEDPELVRREIDHRIKETLDSGPIKKRKETLHKEMNRVQKGIDKLLDAYQEGLLPLSELRKRIPELRKRTSAYKSELESMELRTIEEKKFIELYKNIDDFLRCLKQSSKDISVTDRQKILRLIVKEILVGQDSIKIKHSIPVSGTVQPLNEQSYSLRTRRSEPFVGKSVPALCI